MAVTKTNNPVNLANPAQDTQPVPPVPGLINPNAINSNQPTPVVPGLQVGQTANIPSNQQINPTQPVKNTTTLNAGDYNSQARASGRQDWRTAYKTDILNKQVDLGSIPANNPQTATNTTTSKNPPSTTNITTTNTSKPNEVVNQTIDPIVDPNGAINQWKANGSNINQLESLVEKKYGTTATINNGVLTADINGQTYNWSIDGAGNAIKTLVGDKHQDPNQYFNDLVAGKNITDSNITNTPAYKIASERKANIDKYSNMSPQELSVLINQGEVIPGTQAYNDLKAINPNLVSKAVNTANLNAINKTSKVDFSSKISDAITKFLTPNQTNDLTNALSGNPQVKTLSDELLKAQQKRNEYLDQINNIREDVRKDLGNKSVSKSYMNALVFDRSRKLTRLAKLAIADVTSYGAQLQNLTSNIKYDIQVQQNQDRLNQSKFSTALNFYNTQQQNQATQDYRNNQLNISQQNANTSAFNAQVSAGKPVVIGQNALSQPIYGVPDGQGGYRPVNYTGSTGNTNMLHNGNIDFSTNTSLINSAPNEASFKNNNPTGMTWGISNNLKSLFNKAGINYSQGSYRPANEGGNYIKFATVQDGLNAYKIALTQAGSDKVYNRLATWVGTKDTASNDRYARDIMKKAGIDKNAKFSDLTPTQTDTLMKTQLQKESPAFYKELQKQTKGNTNPYSDIKTTADIRINPKATDAAKTAFGFGKRMETSSDIIKTMEDKYKNSWAVTEYFAPKGDYVPNFLKSTDRQQFEQAQRNFINAILRKESGAVIADSEFANAAQQYFPQPGDSNEVLDQKRANREQVIQTLYGSAGLDNKGRNIVDIYKGIKSNNPVKKTINPVTDISVTQGVNKYFAK